MYPLHQLNRRIGRFEQLDVIKDSIHEVFYRVDFHLANSPLNTWFDWRSLRSRILIYQGRPLLSNRNEDQLSLNDKLSCFVSLSLLLENQDLAQQYWKAAYDDDPIQTTIISFVLADSTQEKQEKQTLLYSLFQQALLDVVQKYNFVDENFVNELQALLDEYPIENIDIYELIDCFAGKMGQRNTTQLPYSLQYREQLLIYWMFKSLLKEDQRQNENHRFEKLYQYNPFYARMFYSLVYNNLASLEIARSYNQYLVAADTLYYRLNSQIQGSNIFFEYFYPFLERELQRLFRSDPNDFQELHDVVNDVLLLLIETSSYKLDFPLEHPSPIAYIRTTIKNRFLDRCKKENAPNKDLDLQLLAELDEPELFTKTIEDTDELQHNILKYLEEFRVEARVAYCLFEAYPPIQWAQEFADELGKSEEDVTALFIEIVKNEDNVDQRNQLMVQLFRTETRILQPNSIYRKYQRVQQALRNQIYNEGE